MKKRASAKKKIRTEIWVALIGLAGVIVTAIFGSPVLIRLLEWTPTPASLTEIATIVSPLPDGGSSVSASATSPALSSVSGCQPAGITELPAQTLVLIESVEGVKTTVSLSSFRFEFQTSLRLASGTNAEFSKMKRVDLTNPKFTDPFTVEVDITLLDCAVHHDIVNSGSDSYLTGDSPLGTFQLHILQVKSIVFEW